ncbi:MAG: tRNA threonylcarbamoyladenosine biosynthesis protein RimN [Gammaproteobacteria bacterium]|nr:tRNA threonylcarbamoyladenosine biosynthesis protein RimN [Gammaproteobacteria bacterium]
MPTRFHYELAADFVAAGAVIAYPTEGVYGLGCDPDDSAAVARILDIKQRSWRQGLILIASTIEQLDPYLGNLDSRQRNRIAVPGLDPVTWIAPASVHAPDWLTGGRATIAVRLTTHPVAAALCDACASALVSTSANISGRAAARSALAVRKQLGSAVDYVLVGQVGELGGATPISDLLTGKRLR